MFYCHYFSSQQFPQFPEDLMWLGMKRDLILKKISCEDADYVIKKI